MMRGYGYGPGYRPLMHGLGPGLGLLAAIFWLLVIAGLVLLVVWLARRTVHASHPATHPAMPIAMAPPATSPHADALATAANRYASGEITREQYEEIRDTLSGGSAPTPPTTEAQAK